MFEKEAEEIAKDIYIHHFDDDVNYPEVLKAITVGVQKGAEAREKENATLKKQLEAEKKLNEEIKVRFVKCNTCTDEMKSKCLMFSENLCEGDRCEELVDLIDLINKSDLQKENATLKKQLEALSGDIPWNELKDVSEMAGKLTEAKETIQALYHCLKNYDKTVLCGELLTAILKAEAFLKE